MRHVISAIEIVVDEHLPVAMDVIHAAVEAMQFAHIERRHSLHQPAKKIWQRRGFWIEIHEHELFPDLDLHRRQAILLAVKVLYPVELRHALQRTVQSIIPTVIRAMQDRSLSARFGNYRGSMVAAHVVEPPQCTVITAHHDNRLSRDIRRNKLPGPLHLLDAAD